MTDTDTVATSTTFSPSSLYCFSLTLHKPEPFDESLTHSHLHFTTLHFNNSSLHITSNESVRCPMVFSGWLLTTLPPLRSLLLFESILRQSYLILNFRCIVVSPLPLYLHLHLHSHLCYHLLSSYPLYPTMP